MPLSLRKKNVEPRWPAAIAVFAIGGLYAVLPQALILVRPRWLGLFVIAAVLVPTIISHRAGQQFLNQIFGYVLNSVVTILMMMTLVRLLWAVTDHTIDPKPLLLSAAALWWSNILVFASWYWRLDGGGPHERALQPGHADGAFLFPQMTMDADAKRAAGEHDWEPNFVDYLFLAFNTSTAFSPTDVPVLSRWAKILMMIQSVISLLVIALLAGRAVNIL
jgi:hypothetical protein